MVHVIKNARAGILTLCISALLIPHKTHSSGWNPGPALVIGGLAALALGVGYCYAYSESDETVVNIIQRYLSELRQEHKADVETFCAFHYITSYPVNIQQLINSADEVNELYPTAERVRNAHTTMRSYLAHINNDLNTLKSHFSKLGYRKNSLERQRNLSMQQQQLLRTMQQLYDEMQDMLAYLGIYHEFFFAHRAYFDLYEYESELYGIYQQEFLYGNTYLYDAIALAKVIRQCVGAKYHASSYPYHAYKRQLNEHINKLQSYMKDAQWYSNRYGWAVQLEQYLIKLRGIIMADESYEKERETRRREREHQQQMQLMQQQQMMQQQLIAQQQLLAMQQARNSQATPNAHVHYNINL